MKLFSLSVLNKGSTKVIPLCTEHEVSSFGYFQRSSAKEFMNFTTKLITERTVIGQRASVKEDEYMCHVYVRNDGLAGVLLSDHEYPVRVAFTLLNKVLDEFTNTFPSSSWSVAQENSLNFPCLKEYLEKYQNPKEADALTKIQNDLDETKIILHNTIEAVLERGEKLDNLVEMSDGLSATSKTFYKTAKKTNSCCVIL